MKRTSSASLASAVAIWRKTSFITGGLNRPLPSIPQQQQQRLFGRATSFQTTTTSQRHRRDTDAERKPRSYKFESLTGTNESTNTRMTSSKYKHQNNNHNKNSKNNNQNKNDNQKNNKNNTIIKDSKKGRWMNVEGSRYLRRQAQRPALSSTIFTTIPTRTAAKRKMRLLQQNPRPKKYGRIGPPPILPVPVLPPPLQRGKPKPNNHHHHHVRHLHPHPRKVKGPRNDRPPPHRYLHHWCHPTTNHLGPTTFTFPVKRDANQFSIKNCSTCGRFSRRSYQGRPCCRILPRVTGRYSRWSYDRRRMRPPQQQK